MIQFDQIKHGQYDWIYVDIDLGNSCTYNCSYCPADAHNGSVPWLQIDALKKFIDKLFQHYTTVFNKELFVFNLLGGEPTLYRDIETLCEYIKTKANYFKVESYIEFLTNGYRKLAWWKKNIDLYDNAKISFHSEFANDDHIVEICDAIIAGGKTANVQILMLPSKWDYCIAAIDKFSKSKEHWAYRPKIVQKEFGPEPYDYTADQLKFLQNSDNFRNGNSEKNYNNKYFYKGKKVDKIYVSDIIINNLHTFFDWKCYAGIDIVRIKRKGDLKLGGTCFMEYPNFTDKTIYEDYEFPTKPTICKQAWCFCGADIKVRKEKIYD